MATGGSAFPAPRPIDRRATIVILTHRHDDIRRGPTIAHVAYEHWEPAGHRILVHRGTSAPPPADLAILHVALTRVPPAYQQHATRYPTTINGQVSDTAKRAVCRDLVTRGDAYQGPVIIKTDLNHGGKAEERLRWRQAGAIKRLWLGLEHRLPASWFGRLPGREYVILPSKDTVPGWVWRSPHLVVQPFYAERRGDLFAMHQWYFLGGRDCVSTFLAREPVVKLANVVERLPLHDDVPELLRRRRAELQFDYGKFDFVMVDGKPILLDANHTPTEGPEYPSIPRVFAICGALAGGLQAFMS